MSGMALSACLRKVSFLWSQKKKKKNNSRERQGMTVDVRLGKVSGVSTRRMATDSNLCSRLSVGQNERKQIEVQQKQNKKGGERGEEEERALSQSLLVFCSRFLFPRPE